MQVKPRDRGNQVRRINRHLDDNYFSLILSSPQREENAFHQKADQVLFWRKQQVVPSSVGIAEKLLGRC